MNYLDNDIEQCSSILRKYDKQKDKFKNVNWFRIAVAAFVTHLIFPIFSMLGFYLYGCDLGNSFCYSYTLSVVIVFCLLGIFVLFVIFSGILLDLWKWATEKEVK